jgi:hypothetical protein
MAEVDTSSYLKPTNPVPKGALDQLQDYQKVESNRIGIDQQKLKLANDHWSLANEALGKLIYDPELNASKIQDKAQELLKLGVMTPDHFSEFVSRIPGSYQLQKDPQALQKYLATTRNQGLANMEALNWFAGNNPHLEDMGSGKQPVTNVQGRVQATGPVTATGLPPTTPGYQKPNAEFPQGRVAPIGPAQSPGLPVGGSPASAPLSPKPVQTISSRLPVQSPNATGRTLPEGASINSPQAFNGRFTGITPGEPPPGQMEAAEIAGKGSGEALARARQSAGNFQREIFPLTQAIPAMEKLGTKGTGPGTETLNHIASFILSNVPGVSEKDPAFANVPTYDKAKKYMVDFVNQTGNTGTNDKLAAAFAGNPSVNISNAAAVDVLKSALSLRLMQQAQYLEFEKSSKPDSEFSKFIAQKNNQLDPRAFGVNYMSPEAKQKLKEQLSKNPKEKELFEKSIQIAHDAGYIVLGK